MKKLIKSVWKVSSVLIILLITMGLLSMMVFASPETCEDAWVESNHPDGNHGDDKKLHTMVEPAETIKIRRSYIKFTSLPEGATSVYLYLYAKSGKEGGTIGIYKVSESWSENDITWNSQKDFGLIPIIPVSESKKYVNETGKYYTFNVASAVTEGTLSLAIKFVDEGTDKQHVDWYSNDETKEADKRPYLEIDGSTIEPTHDAWVESNHPDENHGGDKTLHTMVDSDKKIRRSYIKFTSLPENIDSAMLNLYAEKADHPGEIGIYEVSGEWDESGITWRNAPPLGEKIIEKLVNTEKQWWEFNVTSAATGDNTLSLAIKFVDEGTDKQHVDWYSNDETKEADKRPYLEITVDTTKPTVSITDPSTNKAVSSASYTIKGTANDPGSSGLAKVEVSIDNGSNWNEATGTSSWTYNANLVLGANVIKARSTDNAGNISDETAGVTLTMAGSPSTIELSASKLNIPANGSSTSTITAVVSDEDGNPVADGTKVSFTTTLGTIITSSTTINGVAKATLTSGTTSGTAAVKATVNGASSTIYITFTSGAPPVITIGLTAAPKSIVANGSSTSTITAVVSDEDGNPVADGTKVSFTTTLGTITTSSTTTTTNGVAKATLTSGASSGTATISASTRGVSGTTQVDITADVVEKEVTETISEGKTYLIEGPAESDTTVTVTTTAEVTVTITNYTDNPHPEAASPIDSLDKYCDVSVSNPDAISWPIRVEVSYTDDEIAAKGFIEESLKLYYFKDGAWHKCSDTGVDTINNIVWANMTKEEASGSPVDMKGDTTPETKAKLEITKDGPVVADAGSTITYTITYGNIGTGDATNVVISDVVPEDTTFVSATDGGTYDSATNTATRSIELISAGTTGLTVSFDVEIDNDLPPGTTVITNQAGIASYYGTELTDEALSNEVDTTVVVPFLEIDKSVDASTAVTGDIITYTVKLTNISTHDEALDIEISDKLPFGIVYISDSTAINGVLTSDPSGSNPFSWRIDAIATESTATITYKCAIGLNAVAGFHDNEATIQGYSVDGITLALDSPRAIARVKVAVFETRGIIIGKVFEDLNENGWQDKGEAGIPGIDIVMEDGTTVTTDVDGKYSIPGVEPGYHVLTIDEATLPEGYEILGEVSKFVEVPEVGMAKLNSTVVKQQEGEAKRDSG